MRLLLAIAIAFLYTGAVYAQGVPFSGCCQFVNSCETLSQDACIADPTSMEFFINEQCEPGALTCPSFVVADPEATNVPTLSQWGLIAMAGILGVAGFIVFRKRIATINS